MRNISDKETKDLLTADEYNSSQQELENVVTAAGGTLDLAAGPDNNLYMLAQAIATFSAASVFYEDTTGITNVIILSRESNIPLPFMYIPGMQVLFKATSTNTGACTIEIEGLDTKDLTDSSGSALTGSEITSGNYIRAVYNNTDDRFELIA